MVRLSDVVRVSTAGTYAPDRYVLLYRVYDPLYPPSWTERDMRDTGSGYLAQAAIQEAGEDYEMKIRCRLKKGDDWLSADSPDVYRLTTLECQGDNAN